MPLQRICCSGMSEIEKEKAYREFMNLRAGEKLYREIELSDGKGYILKIFCKLGAEGEIDVIQIGQREEAEGTVIFTGDPMHFDDKKQLHVWLIQTLLDSFDSTPYITICPIQIHKLKEREREHTTAMYW